MPSNTLPFPAELGAAGPFTRESLTGEKDAAGPYKDQAEILWVELIQRFWQDQLKRILSRVEAAGLQAPPAPEPARAIAPGETLFSRAGKAVKAKVIEMTPLKKALEGLTAQMIAVMSEQQAKDFAWALVKAGNEMGMSCPWDREQINALGVKDVKLLVLNTAKGHSPLAYEKWPLDAEDWVTGEKTMTAAALSKAQTKLAAFLPAEKPAAPGIPPDEWEAMKQPDHPVYQFLRKMGFSDKQIQTAKEPLKVPGMLGAAAIPPEEDKQLLMEIGPQLQKDVYQGSAVLYKQFTQAGIQLDWTLINTDAAAWARKYCGLLVKGIQDTTRKAVGEAVAQFVETPGMTHGDLRDKLMELAYPARRAELIARTEVTRAYAQGSMITAMNGEKWKTFPDFRPLYRYFKIWQTKNDHVVCDGCVEIHLAEVEGTKAEFMTPAGPADAPPLHPGCRCWVTFRPETITKEEAKEMFKEAKAKKKLEKEQAKKEAAEKAKREAEKKKKLKEAYEKKLAEEKAKEAAEKAKLAAEKAKKEAAEAEKKLKEQVKQKKLQQEPQTWRPGDPFVQTRATHDSLKGVEVAFGPESDFEGHILNGVPLERIRPTESTWRSFKDRDIGEPPTPTGHYSSGVVMMEPDGRVWIVEPAKHYGGYNYTYPKGGIKSGLTAQQNALKEVFEESGLLADIDGFLGDYVSDQTGNTTRYYVGRRVGGAPWAFQKESQAVYLADLKRARNMLHTWRDLDVLDKLEITLGIKAAEVAEVAAAPMISRAVDIPEGLLPEALPEGVFPENVEGLQNVRGLGGSTGATLVKDPTTGRLYVMKKGASAAHIRSEALADDLYRRLGVKVPSFQLYETAAGPVKLAEYIPDTKQLSEVLSSGTAAAQRKALDQLKQNFVADAWLGNWDVVGTGYDNILIDKDGTAWRIDNGGALFYRAQGNLKADGEFNHWMTELWTMRTDPGRQYAYKVFGGMDWAEVTRQLEFLGGLPEAQLLKGVEGEVLDLLKARLRTVRDLWQTSTRLLGDKWAVQYVDDFVRASVELRQAGLLSQLPKELKHRGGESVTVVDENGRTFDKLRGYGSVSRWIQNYINENGGDWQIVRSWAGGQGGSSWGDKPQAIKWWIAQQRGGVLDYFWREGQGTAQRHYEALVRTYGQAKLDKTLKMWHAFNYEFLRNTPMPNNNLEMGFLKLMRTESSRVLQRHKVRKGTYTTMPRGANESSSIYNSVTVGGHEMTLQVVPHHRVFGMYLTERSDGGTMFLGDDENEFMFIPEGLPFYYWGRTGSTRSSGSYWTDTILNRLVKEVFK